MKHCSPSRDSGCEPEATYLGYILENGQSESAHPPTTTHTKAVGDVFFLRQVQLLPVLNSQLRCAGLCTWPRSMGLKMCQSHSETWRLLLNLHPLPLPSPPLPRPWACQIIIRRTLSPEVFQQLGMDLGITCSWRAATAQDSWTKMIGKIPKIKGKQSEWKTC